MNPLTAVYGGVTRLRNTLFDRGVLPARRLARPVISVGNLSVGGTGKTPFVIALGELLKERGICFDVLSRGYRRKTRGTLIVEADGRATDFGDEPLLIARRLGVPVVVGESRYHAGQLAEQRFQSQLHILDDGFQHRSLARDFDIVLLTERDFDDGLLPIGRMREPLSSLRRADAIVVSEELSGKQLSAIERATDSLVSKVKLIWRMRRQVVIPVCPASPIVFSGIARPKQFFAQVRGAGIIPAAEVTFRDHHAYDRADITRLLRAYHKYGAQGFLTTEKDSINLEELQAKLNPLVIATLDVTFETPTELIDTLLAHTSLAKIAEPQPRS